VDMQVLIQECLQKGRGRGHSTCTYYSFGVLNSWWEWMRKERSRV
jgi:hypothetical protein